MKTLLCLHGIFDRPSVFDAFKIAFESKGFQVIVPNLHLRWGFTRIETAAETFKKTISSLTLEAKNEIVLVGFSMGGIIARYYLQEMNGLADLKEKAKFESFITISSPHHGSLLGYGSPGRGGFSLRPSSPLLRQLKESESKLSGLRILSLYTPHDLMILPASSSIWKLATNIEVEEKTHAAMLKSERVFDEIEKWIEFEGKIES
ncbi:MAG: hypothetical protein SFU91_04710 [Chloroherpetonaceae bacterium]|nr:hypothetical protein [Chloroherpetonaceae bacterium]